MLKITSLHKIAFESSRLYPDQKPVASALEEWGVPEGAANLVASMEVYQFAYVDSDGLKVYKLDPLPGYERRISLVEKSIKTKLPTELFVGEQVPDHSFNIKSPEERAQWTEEMKGDIGLEEKRTRI